MSENQEDQELIAKISKGDKRAFRSLLEKYQKQVYGYSVRIIGDRVMAEDIAQETWIRVCKASEDYSPTGSVKSWILRICRNLCIDEIRNQNRWSDFSEANDKNLENLEDDSESADQLLSDNEQLKRLAKYVDTLAPDQRALLMMSLAEGLQYSEIAGQLGISVANVKVSLFRIRQSLKEKMEAS